MTPYHFIHMKFEPVRKVIESLICKFGYIFIKLLIEVYSKLGIIIFWLDGMLLSVSSGFEFLIAQNTFWCQPILTLHLTMFTEKTIYSLHQLGH